MLDFDGVENAGFVDCVYLVEHCCCKSPCFMIGWDGVVMHVSNIVVDTAAAVLRYV